MGGACAASQGTAKTNALTATTMATSDGVIPRTVARQLGVSTAAPIDRGRGECEEELNFNPPKSVNRTCMGIPLDSSSVWSLVIEKRVLHAKQWPAKKNSLTWGARSRTHSFLAEIDVEVSGGAGVSEYTEIPE